MNKKTIAVLIIVALFVALIVRGQLAQFDTDWNRPDDIVRTFLEAVRKEDYTTARTMWSEEAQPRLVGQLKAHSFEELCRNEYRVDTYNVKVKGTDRGYFHVGVTGEVISPDGQSHEKSYMVYLVLEKKRWRLTIGYW